MLNDIYIAIIIFFAYPSIVDIWGENLNIQHTQLNLWLIMLYKSHPKIINLHMWHYWFMYDIIIFPQFFCISLPELPCIMQIFHTPTSMIVILDNRYNITFDAFLGDMKFLILIISPFKTIIYVNRKKLLIVWSGRKIRF